MLLLLLNRCQFQARTLQRIYSLHARCALVSNKHWESHEGRRRPTSKAQPLQGYQTQCRSQGRRPSGWLTYILIERADQPFLHLRKKHRKHCLLKVDADREELEQRHCASPLIAVHDAHYFFRRTEENYRDGDTYQRKGFGNLEPVGKERLKVVLMLCHVGLNDRDYYV